MPLIQAMVKLFPLVVILSPAMAYCSPLTMSRENRRQYNGPDSDHLTDMFHHILHDHAIFVNQKSHGSIYLCNIITNNPLEQCNKHEHA